MDSTNPFYKQVSLLVELLPIIGKQSCFALKGGTAINLFLRNLPRLSVDIDLAYLPLSDREYALREIDNGLRVISNEIKKSLPSTSVIAHPNPKTGTLFKLNVKRADAVVKIEVTPVLRGAVFKEERHSVCSTVEEHFGFAEIQMLNFNDIYAGKICAALDRQHPRDLYDILVLLNNEGLSRELIIAFLVYLVSHNRPMAELLSPRSHPINNIFDSEFLGMTVEEVKLTTLEKTLPRLVKELHKNLTSNDKRFLLSFKKGDPDWGYLGLEHIEQLPSIRWKLFNLNKMNKKKRLEAIRNLEDVLDRMEE